jgi:prophage antirepressor-like protein
MSNIQLFDFRSNVVRVILKDNEPWFVGNEICKILDLDNITEALRRLKTYEIDDFSFSDTTGRIQNMKIISESGLSERWVKTPSFKTALIVLEYTF